MTVFSTSKVWYTVVLTVCLSIQKQQMKLYLWECPEFPFWEDSVGSEEPEEIYKQNKRKWDHT